MPGRDKASVRRSAFRYRPGTRIIAMRWARSSPRGFGGRIACVLNGFLPGRAAQGVLVMRTMNRNGFN